MVAVEEVIVEGGGHGDAGGVRGVERRDPPPEIEHDIDLHVGQLGPLPHPAKKSRGGEELTSSGKVHGYLWISISFVSLSSLLRFSVGIVN
ncbi:hypothetical protein LWI28_025010 [Acer negundo]|uniref:Uncharacterized protein n=1 Tax=Acer negundo TaxID=4023 RepID=A0AAD5JFG7_ACENE|nr:hypothetical protein LWI28_025010 [Acer negundo]